MMVVFANDSLGLVETDDAGKTQLPALVIKVARRKLTILRATIDDRSLRNWKSLRHETLLDDRENQRFVRLNEKYRMVFKLDEQQEPPITTIIAIEDCH